MLSMEYQRVEERQKEWNLSFNKAIHFSLGTASTSDRPNYQLITDNMYIILTSAHPLLSSVGPALFYALLLPSLSYPKRNKRKVNTSTTE